MSALPPLPLRSASAISVGAVSGLGIGTQAYRAAMLGKPAMVAIRRDETLANAGLLKPNAARAQLDLELSIQSVFEDRATQLLACAMDQLTTQLSHVRPGWRRERVAIAIGTSSGGMLTCERYFGGRAAGQGPELLRPLACRATYFAPMNDVLGAFDLAHIERRTLILAACAASTIAIGMGLRWLDRNACDLVIAGGFDAISVFVASGFEALRATTATRPRPFKKGRDGMSLGEGAGLVALVRHGEEKGAATHLFVSGFGASTDAVHITAPDITGSGLARAALAALRDSGQTEADLVSAHATATPYNDAMEAKAIHAALPTRPIVHPFKAQIGHTLGAAGVLETLAISDALAQQVAPAAVCDGETDADADVVLLPVSEARSLRRAVKLSAAFGGANAALVLTKNGDEERPPKTWKRVVVAASVHITSCDLTVLAAKTGAPRERLARLDSLCRYGALAVATLAERVGREALVGAGVVAGHGLATIETNEAFDSKKRTKGPTLVEPRVFPATSPNAIAGECAILFKLTGPSFATGAGLNGAAEALLCAAELVAAGDALRMVVVAADDAGPVGRDLLVAMGLSHRPLAAGAVALLLTASDDSILGGGAEQDASYPSSPPREPKGVHLDMAVSHADGPIGHLALLPWI